MRIANSPLRYPGGKAVLSDFLAAVVAANGMQDGTYIEPYAGGAGAALDLLFAERVQRIILNDADPCIFAFWNAILNRKDDFIRRVKETPVAIDEWNRQREIHRHHVKNSRIKVAFATFYLNRCNRSGIVVDGGPIGGLDQSGKWKLDVRYNKNELIRRIEKIHLYRNRIEIHNLDAIEFLQEIIGHKERLDDTLIYLDPPYYINGGRLYLNHYRHEDHAKLSSYLMQHITLRWLLTYDNVTEINELYRNCQRIPFQLPYSIRNRRTGSELLIHRGNLAVPRESLLVGQR